MNIRGSISRWASIGIFLASLPVAAAHATGIQFSQGRQADVAIASSTSLSFTNNVSSSDELFVYVTWFSSTSTATVADTLNAAPFSSTTALVNTNKKLTTQLWYKENSASGPDTITAAITNPGGTRMCVDILEYSGVASANSLDTFASAIDSISTTTHPTPLISTANANELILGNLGGSNMGTVSVAPPYTMRVNGTSGAHCATADFLAGAATTTGAVFTSQYANMENKGTFAFKPASTDTTPPSVPANLASSNITATGATISWAASTDPDSAVSGYNIYRNGNLVGTVASTSFNNAGLSASTTYSYAVAAFDPAGNISLPSSPLSVTTAPDTTPPSIPTGLSASNITASTFSLAWLPSTDPDSSIAYYVYQNGLLAATTTLPSLNVSGLAPNTAYSYAVAAFDPSMNVSAQSAALPVTTLPLDTIPPTVSITSPMDGATVSGTIPLSANATDNVGVTQVQFYIDGALGGAATSSPYTMFWNTAGFTNASHTLFAAAYDAAGNVGTSTPVVVAVNNTAPPLRHYLYTMSGHSPGTLSIYDMDNGFILVQTSTVPLVYTGGDARGMVIAKSTGIMYVSHGCYYDINSSYCPLHLAMLAAYNIATGQELWDKSYPFGIDSMSITPDGQTIYMPVGEGSTSTLTEVLDGNGNVLGSIDLGIGQMGPHNSIVSNSGAHVYVGPRNGNYLIEANTSNNAVIQKIGPTKSGVRPFTINSSETLSFTTATGMLGFQVGDINSGKILYTVTVAGFSGCQSWVACSHGISLSPDGKEIYLVDIPNNYVHVFDVSGLPASPPVQVANIPLIHPYRSGTGWLTHSRDGRYVFVGSSGDVIDTVARGIIAYIPVLNTTDKFEEVDYQNGDFKTGTLYFSPLSRSGVGY